MKKLLTLLMLFASAITITLASDTKKDQNFFTQCAEEIRINVPLGMNNSEESPQSLNLYKLETTSVDENDIPGKTNNPTPRLFNEQEEIQKPKYLKLEKFCLSFEFQENSGLCPWALHKEYFLKRPLFSAHSVPTFEQIKPVWLLFSQERIIEHPLLFEKFLSLYCTHKTKKLFHVEIDDKDIEFVTNKFYNCPQERLWLNLCIENILLSLNILKGILKGHNTTTFAKWVEEFKNEIFSKPSPKIPLENILILASNSGLEDLEIYSKSNNWAPKFSPQATIQHDLSFTIPLYFSLFGNGNPFFLTCLPYLDELSAAFINSERVIKEEMKDQDNLIKKSYENQHSLLKKLNKDNECLHHKLGNRNNTLEKVINQQREALDQAFAEIDDELWESFNRKYVDKEMGLIFLHACTLLHMTPLEEKDGKLSEVTPKDMKDKEKKHKDADFLNETLENYRKSNQIDAKSRLPLMSRRPFSEMLREIMEYLTANSSSVILEEGFSDNVSSDIEHETNEADISLHGVVDNSTSDGSSSTDEEAVIRNIFTNVERETLSSPTNSAILAESFNDDYSVVDENDEFFYDDSSDFDDGAVTNNSFYDKGEESQSLDLSYEAEFDNTPDTPYTSLFLGAMGPFKNKLFSEMIKNFYKTNYGEQFLCNNAPLDLQYLLECFNDKFVSDNNSTLKELLKNGIITTVMIRNFKKDITIEPLEELGSSQEGRSACDLLNKKNEFYRKSLSSVDSPTERYALTIDSISQKLSVSSLVSYFDSLSPPWFLELKNSMGRFREEEMKGQNSRSYGGAIIELRGIKKVDEWFITDEAWFNKYEDKAVEPSSSFLTQPEVEDTFVSQAMGLYDFLERFDLNSPGIKEKVLTSIARGVFNASKNTYSIH
ncbi:MAG: hypothetical protein ACOH2V_12810 [Candidatus Saccharimonadaceae bacterium]